MRARWLGRDKFTIANVEAQFPEQGKESIKSVLAVCLSDPDDKEIIQISNDGNAPSAHHSTYCLG